MGEGRTAHHVAAAWRYADCPTTLDVQLTVAFPDAPGEPPATATWTLALVCRAPTDALKLTFTDYDGAVHYSRALGTAAP
jgi:hypothetical protein